MLRIPTSTFYEKTKDVVKLKTTNLRFTFKRNTVQLQKFSWITFSSWLFLMDWFSFSDASKDRWIVLTFLDVPPESLTWQWESTNLLLRTSCKHQSTIVIFLRWATCFVTIPERLKPARRS